MRSVSDPAGTVPTGGQNFATLMLTLLSNKQVEVRKILATGMEQQVGPGTSRGEDTQTGKVVSDDKNLMMTTPQLNNDRIKIIVPTNTAQLKFYLIGSRQPITHVSKIPRRLPP
jgi:hypothetical protein